MFTLRATMFLIPIVSGNCLPFTLFAPLAIYLPEVIPAVFLFYFLFSSASPKARGTTRLEQSAHPLVDT